MQADSFFFDPASRAQGTDPVMNEPQRSFYEELKSACSESLIQLQANYAVSKTPTVPGSGGANATGYVVALSKEAPLSAFVTRDGKTLFTPRWFTHHSVVEVPVNALDPHITEDEMVKIVEEMCASVSFNKHRAEEQVKLTEAIVTDATSVVDKQQWCECIGKCGDQISIRRRPDMGFGKPSYYITVRSGSGMLGEALCHFALAHPNMKLGEFVMCEIFKRTEMYALRLNRRLIAKALVALGITDDLGEDTLAHRNADDDEAYPLMYTGKLMADTRYNYFHEPTAHGLTLIYYCGTTRITDSAQHGYVAYMQGYQSGVKLYAVKSGVDYAHPVARVVRPGSEYQTLGHENPYKSFPVGSGRITLEKNTKTVLFKASKMNKSTVVSLHSRHFWPGRKTQAAPIVVRSEEDAVALLNSRLYSYRTPDRGDEERLDFIMTADGDSVIPLETVAAVIASDDV